MLFLLWQTNILRSLYCWQAQINWRFRLWYSANIATAIAQSRYKARYEQWLEDRIADCRVLDVTEATTHHYAAIHLELRQTEKPIPTNDLWIAALSRQHHLSILSRDRHFDLVRGVVRVDW